VVEMKEEEKTKIKLNKLLKKFEKTKYGTIEQKKLSARIFALREFLEKRDYNCIIERRVKAFDMLFAEKNPDVIKSYIKEIDWILQLRKDLE
jgi:hypothetical protein